LGLSIDRVLIYPALTIWSSISDTTQRVIYTGHWDPWTIFRKPEFNYIQYPISEPTNRCTPECRACLPEVGSHTARRQRIIIYNAVYERQTRIVSYIKYIYTLYTESTCARQALNSDQFDQYSVTLLTVNQQTKASVRAYSQHGLPAHRKLRSAGKQCCRSRTLTTTYNAY